MKSPPSHQLLHYKNYKNLGAKQIMDYFDRVQCHVQGDMDLDSISSDTCTKIITLGSDDLVTWRSLWGNESRSVELEPDHGYSKIAMDPSGSKFLLAGNSKKVCEYSTESKSMIALVYESLGNITDIKYSPNGRFISIASEQQKVVVIDTVSGRKTKCRPGHSNKVLNVFFSPQSEYVASISQDCYVLVYELAVDRDPQQIFKAKFTNEIPPPSIQGSFASTSGGHKVFIPGTTQLQVIGRVSSRWQLKQTNIAHSSPILISQAITSTLLVTVCQKDVCLWSIEEQSKLIVLEDWSLTRVKAIQGGFIGCRNDGAVYVYNRPLPKQSKPVEATAGHEDMINFEDEEMQQKIELQYEENESDGDRSEEVIRKAKKRMADKLIKVYPQNQLFRQTQYFDDNRFLFMNAYGYIIQSRQNEEETCIYVEMRREDGKEVAPKLLFRNRELIYFDVNWEGVCYSNESEFGLKVDRFSSWEHTWFDIQGITLSATWLAVANSSEVRVFDVSGNHLKTICFDRPILSLVSYNNFLALAYHQSVPMYESQIISMKVYNLNQSQSHCLSESHIPLTTPLMGDKGSVLRWFGFSAEGMLFSQDSYGIIRAFSLESNEWTSLYFDGLNDSRKAWIVGISNYEVIFWRTTDSQPEPTVRPRLNLKSHRLVIYTLNEGVEELETYSFLLWKRYCLDHELARWRLWGRCKAVREAKQTNYSLSEKAIYDRHQSLDVQFYPIIKYYIKSEQPNKALSMVKNNIRSIQMGKNLIDLFEESGLRSLAIDLECFFEQKQRQVEYEAMQELQLKQLMSKIEVSAKPKKQNPMNPKFKKTNISPLPFSLSQSQQSQHSSQIKQVTHPLPQNSKMDETFLNPFLKKKSTNQDRKQEIEEHIKKYGVKTKAEDKRRNQ